MSSKTKGGDRRKESRWLILPGLTKEPRIRSNVREDLKRKEQEMAYEKSIDRAHPAAVVFVLDQSSSMQAAISSGDGVQSKADAVAYAVNSLLSNLVTKCAKPEGVRDYLHVAVIGYGVSVGPAFEGALAGRELVPISEIAANPSRVEERVEHVDYGGGETGDQTVRTPVWIDPKGENGTPMKRAFEYAENVVKQFIADHPDSYPPIVFNITDGEGNDGEFSGAAKSVMSLASNDGDTLIYNIHLSSVKADPIEFPDSDKGLPDKFARRLFEISSMLPGKIQAAAREQGFSVSEMSRGFAFNADLACLVNFLDTGTQVNVV